MLKWYVLLFSNFKVFTKKNFFLLYRLKYLNLGLLLGIIFIFIKEDNDIDDIEDEEDMGEEEESTEIIENAHGILLGEELLMKEFALRGEEAIKVKYSKIIKFYPNHY